MRSAFDRKELCHQPAHRDRDRDHRFAQKRMYSWATSPTKRSCYMTQNRYTSSEAFCTIVLDAPKIAIDFMYVAPGRLEI